MAFYDWGLGADVMIFNLRFRTSLVKLAIQLHPVIEMSLFVFFILKVSTIFYFERYFWPRYWHFVICNLWPRCPAASFCIVSAGSLKLGGRGALRRWRFNRLLTNFVLKKYEFQLFLPLLKICKPWIKYLREKYLCTCGRIHEIDFQNICLVWNCFQLKGHNVHRSNS